MDIRNHRYPSLCLFRLLERTFGTKEVVDLSRNTNTMREYVKDVNTTFKAFISGSRGEGLHFKSSDIDLMVVVNQAIVLESIDSAQSDDGNKTVLLMKREGCNPGFVILQLLNSTNDPFIRESIVEFAGYPVVCSLVYRDQYRLPGFGQVAHGPCNTYTEIGVDMDTAVCFKCDTWPTEASEFIYRKRLHEWPPKSLLDKIVCRGCHLVPIGDKNHDLSYIQWRLSFSAAEKDLIHSFNHTQFFAYGLMKIFLKQVINKFQSANDILCSYFLKTAMFYSIERTPLSFWREDLLIPCFWICLNQLIEWVKIGYCPNYFVPQNNMFRSKVYGENQRNVLNVLHSCTRMGWMCIYLCEDLKALQIVVSDHELYSKIKLSKKQREACLDSVAFSSLCISLEPDKRIMYKILARSLTLLQQARTKQEEYISTFSLHSILRFSAITNDCNSVGIKNKDKYRNLYRMLLSSAKSNVCTGSLYLATFYYNTGQHKKAVHLCNRVILHWKSCVMYRSAVKNTVYNGDMYARYMCGRLLSVIDKAQSALAFEIVIGLEQKKFYPAELHHDIEASDPFILYMPPIPYTMFLLFLCHHKLGNIDNSVTALHVLQVLVHDEQQGCVGYPVVLNMLAVCQDKFGDVHGAIDTCFLSQRMNPNKNGADKILSRLLCQYS